MAAAIALFGGTFDPIHFGHLILARSVAEQLGAERTIFIPSASPPTMRQAQQETARSSKQVRVAIAVPYTNAMRRILLPLCLLIPGRCGAPY